MYIWKEKDYAVCVLSKVQYLHEGEEMVLLIS